MVSLPGWVSAVGKSRLGGRSAIAAEPSLDEVMAERFRERTRPRRGDWAYAHFLDLRDALAEVLRDASGVWLDYGSGTSPYRELFAAAELQTADIPGGESYVADHALDRDGSCPVPDGTFDGVLSTQVLEHVTDADAYLREAFRLLRPGGRLVLSTHGVWEEHGGQDLWRWTADGLALQAERAGFAVDRTVKLTCGPRGLLLLLRWYGRDHGWPGGGPVGLVLRTLRLVDRLLPRAVDSYLDRAFGDLGRREGPESAFYLDILLVARKPEDAAVDARDTTAAKETGA
ncbi:class I SAM-dependent methyltransferase [Spongiactinospora sp. TRM90649]|uniref:class I SAM-dependent methyltransferase n=1 Tax=Spongiactinospora sp. TRM90649 TaxID=3031114 RepID=UPI0023F8D76F|nr:class I SAM-dependent methyltransferase [Spongiactinospora sp. TRM90649]MDF5753460.1 class I SAM-dependent methyltransferase [Spongiactinospora sp. TRM90649]